MRPIRGTTRVLVLALDGVGDGALREALSAGDMPRLAAFLGADSANADGDVWAHAYAAPGVASVFPSETAAGWVAVYTGRRPADTGVPGNEWFDREALRFFAPVPLSVESYAQTVSVYSDGLLGEIVATPTLFERADVRAHVALGFVYRGADLVTLPDPTELGELVSSAAEVIFTDADGRELVEELGEDTAEGVRDGVERFGVPDLQIAYFPGPDLAAHGYGRDARQAYLRNEVDERIGEVLDLYRERGALDSTYVVLTSDHGHTPRPEDERHALGHEADLRPLFDSLGVRLRPVDLGTDETARYQAVLAYNGATAFVYLADRSTCPAEGDACDWSAPPRLEEDVLPVARAFHEASEQGARVPALRGALHLVLARTSAPGAGLPSGSPPFEVFDGDRLVPVAEYLAAHPDLDLVELEERLGWLTDGPLGDRAGDVLLLSTATAGMPLDERFYFGEPTLSGHGSAGRLDSLVPLVLAHPNRSGAALRDRLRAAVGERPTQLDVTALVLDLLEERAASGEPGGATE
jgi:hypothetical protein